MKKDSFNANEIPADKGLSGNEKIEEAIAALQEKHSSGFRQCRLQMESSGGLLLQDLRKN